VIAFPVVLDPNHPCHFSTPQFYVTQGTWASGSVWETRADFAGNYLALPGRMGACMASDKIIRDMCRQQA